MSRKLNDLLVEWHRSSKAMYAAQERYEKRGHCPDAGTGEIHHKECSDWDSATERFSAAERELKSIAEKESKKKLAGRGQSGD